MGLVIFKRFNDVGQATIAFSALESAGFHPSWNNFHHAQMANIEMIAFGGMIILLPDTEVPDAKIWLENLQNRPLMDGDEIPEKKKGLWYMITSRPLLLLVLWLVQMNAIMFLRGPKPLFVLTALAIVPLSFLLHAKYIAVPKMERRRTHVH